MSNGMYWIQDPWLISKASHDKRLALRKGIGPYSAGTMVEVNISHESEGFFYVRPIGSNKPPIMATIHDLVIRRKRY